VTEYFYHSYQTQGLVKSAWPSLPNLIIPLSAMRAHRQYIVSHTVFFTAQTLCQTVLVPQAQSDYSPH
jgi:hypothetical protein